MQKISPFMWFDDQAEEAAHFYTAIFSNSRIGEVTRYGRASAEAAGVPEGTVMTVGFELEGQPFTALNGGPQFAFSPAVSFYVSCETEQEVERRWQKLAQGGRVLMELGEYPFSKRFGWLEDKYGVSWQLNLERREQKITPSLLFVGAQQGKAEEAMKLYTSLFKNAAITAIARYEAGEMEPEGTVKQATFALDGYEFRAMDSSLDHAFTFTPAISFLVQCANQEEVDSYWERLTEGGEEQPCGWLADRYGVSWQIVPTLLLEMLQDEDAERAESVAKAMLQMRKIEIDKLEQAYTPYAWSSPI